MDRNKSGVRKYFYTLLFLKPIQIQYQIWYRIRRSWRKIAHFKYPIEIPKDGSSLTLTPWIKKPVSVDITSEEISNAEYTFDFLNKPKSFQKNSINWNFNGFGKLWTYNICYFDFLLQPGMKSDEGLFLINNFLDKKELLSAALDPYPISVRGINWIKFLSKTNPDKGMEYLKGKARIDSFQYAQYIILIENIEYHLLANHLLENGFSLLFGAYYFSDQSFYNKAKQILVTELNEQILDDGAHFELSPMYHQIILDRLLDCINLLQNNDRFSGEEKLLTFIQGKAQRMLNWLNIITFSNGQIPMLNDAAPGIAPTTQQLNEYASRLELTLNPLPSPLGASGYRKFTTPSYECIIDIGQIGPSYQPGHAHADTFNFVLNVNNKPIIVDTGISTYDTGETRIKERGTAAHNTVTVKDKNSSEVWSSFRVARRANVKVLKEDNKTVIARHNGYRNIGTAHQREWNFSDKQIKISDKLEGKIREGKAHFWLAPNLKPVLKGSVVFIDNIELKFENFSSIELIETDIPCGFNQFQTNNKIEVAFFDFLKTALIIEDIIPD